MCALTYTIHRGAMLTVSVPLHEMATWAETRVSRGHGIWPRRPDRVVQSRPTSILSPPNSTQPSLSQNGGDYNALINMPIKVLFVLHQKAAVSQPPREPALSDDRLSWDAGIPSVTTGVFLGMCEQGYTLLWLTLTYNQWPIYWLE